MAETLVTCLTWIPKGKAKTVPIRMELSEAEQKMLDEQQAREALEQAEAAAAAAAAAVDSNDESKKKNKKKKKAAQVEVDEDDADMDGIESLSDQEDYIIRDTDFLLVVGSTAEDNERNAVEVQVFDSEEQNVYVHHDFPVPDLPLCVEWLDFDCRKTAAATAPGASGSFIAVGTMNNPSIEIWNLDVIDVLEPVAILGGVVNNDGPSGEGPEGAEYEIEFLPGSHRDSVLSLSWNKLQRNTLLSASADSTVKLWDLNVAQCVETFEIHEDKVNSVAWNPVDAPVAASGGFDRRLRVFNVTQKNNVLMAMIPKDHEIENVIWNPHNAAIIGVTTEQGVVMFFDVRKLAQGDCNPVAAFKPHEAPVSSLSFNPLVPNVIATASHDGHIKIWDLEGSQIRLLADRAMGVGSVFGMAYHPDSSFILAGAGAEGTTAVWDTSENSTIERRCSA